VQYPGGHRIRRRQPGEHVGRQWGGTGHEHKVAEPPASQHPGIGDQAYVREHRAGGGNLRPGMGQRRPVRHVGREHAVVAQHPAGGRGEFHRGQMGRRAPPGEHISDDHGVGSGAQPFQHRPGVPDPDPDPARRKPLADQVHQRGIDLHGQLRRARAGRRHVAGQSEGPGAQVQHSQRLPRRRRRVDHVPQPPGVLEVEVSGIVQVHMRLRDAVDQQHPRGRAVSVAQ
jgi:hypothetical protein